MASKADRRNLEMTPPYLNRPLLPLAVALPQMLDQIEAKLAEGGRSRRRGTPAPARRIDPMAADAETDHLARRALHRCARRRSDTLVLAAAGGSVGSNLARIPRFGRPGSKIGFGIAGWHAASVIYDRIVCRIGVGLEYSRPDLDRRTWSSQRDRFGPPVRRLGVRPIGPKNWPQTRTVYRPA